MHVVLSADTIIHVSAVMIEFLNTAVATFAVIAVFMHIHTTAIAPNQ